MFHVALRDMAETASLYLPKTHCKEETFETLHSMKK